LCSDPNPSNVTSLCWSANGRYLLSGHAKPGSTPITAADKAELQKAKNCIILWDVLTGKQVCEGVCLTAKAS
jgi:hypothetical protein